MQVIVYRRLVYVAPCMAAHYVTMSTTDITTELQQNAAQGTLVLATLRVRITRHQRHDTRYGCLQHDRPKQASTGHESVYSIQALRLPAHPTCSLHAYQVPAIYPYTAVYLVLVVLIDGGHGVRKGSGVSWKVV